MYACQHINVKVIQNQKVLSNVGVNSLFPAFFQPINNYFILGTDTIHSYFTIVKFKEENTNMKRCRK